MNPVQNEPPLNLTGFKKDPVVKKSGFTQVPNTILRQAGLFNDPTDFMIYLILFSYSYGFNRKTVDMSQHQLEIQTGLSRNCVRRSLDRLTKSKWIKLVGEFEAARISRKWEVKHPDETGPDLDPVQNEPGSKVTRSCSKMDPVTGFKLNPYKEIKQIKNKETLSLKSEILDKYFSELKPKAKKESELGAYQKLRDEFTENEIETAFCELQKTGLPSTGEICHSPVQFLTQAMGEVLKVVNIKQKKELEMLEKAKLQTEIENKTQEKIKQENTDWEKKEKAFLNRFKTEIERQAQVSELCKNTFFSPNSHTGRSYAIGLWWRTNY